MKANITLVNRLARNDTLDHKDYWYKTVLNNCEYSVEKVVDMSGVTVAMGQTFVILIPFNNYVPYPTWKKSNRKESTYTLSVGDYIFIDSIIPDTITSDNIQSIRNQYEPKVCEVKLFKEVAQNGIAQYQLKVEGV